MLDHHNGKQPEEQPQGVLVAVSRPMGRLIYRKLNRSNF